MKSLLKLIALMIALTFQSPAGVDAKPSQQIIVFELVHAGETEPFEFYTLTTPLKNGKFHTRVFSGDVARAGEVVEQASPLGFFDNISATGAVDDLDWQIPGKPVRLDIELTAHTKLGGNFVNGRVESDVTMPVTLAQTLNATVYLADQRARAWIGELFYMPDYPKDLHAYAVSVFVGMPSLNRKLVPKPWRRQAMPERKEVKQ